MISIHFKSGIFPLPTFIIFLSDSFLWIGKKISLCREELFYTNVLSMQKSREQKCLKKKGYTNNNPHKIGSTPFA